MVELLSGLFLSGFGISLLLRRAETEVPKRTKLLNPQLTIDTYHRRQRIMGRVFTIVGVGLLLLAIYRFFLG